MKKFLFLFFLLFSTSVWAQSGFDTGGSSSGGGGSGISGLTTNKVSKATSSTTVGDSQIFDDGVSVGIGSTALGRTFHVEGYVTGRNFNTNFTGEDTEVPFYNSFNVDNTAGGNILLLPPSFGGAIVIGAESMSSFSADDGVSAFYLYGADSGSGYVTDVSVHTGGSGYTVGDRVTVSADGWGNCVLRISAVNGSGAVTAVVMEWAGSQYTTGTNLPAHHLKASGSGLTLDVNSVGTRTDADGGDVIISSGPSTGSGASSFVVNTPTAGSTGTTTRSPVERFRVKGAQTTVTGELNVSGVSGDGSGKVVCIKSDGNMGTCSSAVGAGGTCTCG